MLIPLEEEGIFVNINGVKKNVFIVAPQFFGDNLALNTVFGFNRSFISNYMCRCCMVHRNESEFMTELREDLIRNDENYNNCLAGATSDAKKGVKYCSLWNRLGCFSVPENISVDLLHDDSNMI